MTRFVPSAYPGARPDGPALVYAGTTFPLTVGPSVTAPVTAPSAAAGAAVLDPAVTRWVVAFGANACPDRLLDKALDVRGALLLPARLRGWRTAWEARRSATGAVPLTLVPAPGHVLDTWVLGVHRDDLGALDLTESRGSNYVVGRVGAVVVAARFELPTALAYGPGPATRVLTAGGDLACHPVLDQAAAAALLEGLGVAVGVDPLPDPVAEGWPETPLQDLPLFVYGTLRPDGSRFDQIAELVEVAEEVTVAGRAVATYYGWPAATFAGSGRVVGTLLRPRGAAEAAELYARVDRIEDVPALFRRVPVLAWDGAVSCWAAAYEWNPVQGPPPGEPIEDGRWAPA